MRLSARRALALKRLALGDPLERIDPDVSHTARPIAPLNVTLIAGWMTHRFCLLCRAERLT